MLINFIYFPAITAISAKSANAFMLRNSVSVSSFSIRKLSFNDKIHTFVTKSVESKSESLFSHNVR